MQATLHAGCMAAAKGAGCAASKCWVCCFRKCQLWRKHPWLGMKMAGLYRSRSMRVDNRHWVNVYVVPAGAGIFRAEACSMLAMEVYGSLRENGS